MPVKRRVSKHVDVKITLHALEAFAAMERVRGPCRCDRSNTYRSTRDRCQACRRWWSLHHRLDEELELPPWRYPVILPAWRRRAGAESDEQAELWAQLAAALEAQRRAAAQAAAAG